MSCFRQHHLNENTKSSANLATHNQTFRHYLCEARSLFEIAWLTIYIGIYITLSIDHSPLQQNVASPLANERKLSAASEVEIRSGGEGVNSSSQQLTTASFDNFSV